MIRIGKYNLGYDETIESITLNKLTKITYNNIQKLILITNFTLSNVYVGYRQYGTKSFYAEGYINNEHILFARKEYNSSMAGQTKIDSEKSVKQFNKIITKSLIEILTELKIS